MVFTENLSWAFQHFIPTGTYAGIGTTCVEFENIMKSARKKKDHPLSQRRVVPRHQMYIFRRSWHLEAVSAGVDPSLGVMSPRHFRLTSSRLG